MYGCEKTSLSFEEVCMDREVGIAQKSLLCDEKSRNLKEEELEQKNS